MRRVVFWLLAPPWTAVLVLGCFLAWLFPRRRLLQHRIVALWGRGVLAFAGARFSVERDAPEPEGPFLAVANHASMLDICAAVAAVRPPFLFVSRPFFFRVPVLGWGMRAVGFLPLDPKRPRDAVRALDEAAARLAAGDSLLLFPEGTRSPDGAMRDYKRGPFLTAVRAQVPVLPLAISGAHAVLPRGFLAPRAGAIRVRIGAATPPGDDARALASRVESWTREALKSGPRERGGAPLPPPSP